MHPNNQLWLRSLDEPSLAGNQAQQLRSQSPPESQPPLSVLYPSVTALHCSFAPNERLGLTSGHRQLAWWHSLGQIIEQVLSRFEAVPADRSDNGICGVFGVSSSEEVQDDRRAHRAVQCALALLDAIGEVRLPGGEALEARVGLHTGIAVDGLVGRGNTLHYRLVGPALTVAKRLSQHAPWGGLLASKEAVREQGELAASWRFQEALRVDSGGLVDAYALQMRAVFGYARRTSPQRLAPGGAPVLAQYTAEAPGWQGEGAAAATAHSLVQLTAATRSTAPLRRDPTAAEPGARGPMARLIRRASSHADLDAAHAGLGSGVALSALMACSAEGGPQRGGDPATSLFSTNDNAARERIRRFARSRSDDVTGGPRSSPQAAAVWHGEEPDLALALALEQRVARRRQAKQQQKSVENAAYRLLSDGDAGAGGKAKSGTSSASSSGSPRRRDAGGAETPLDEAATLRPRSPSTPGDEAGSEAGSSSAATLTQSQGTTEEDWAGMDLAIQESLRQAGSTPSGGGGSVPGSCMQGLAAASAPQRQQAAYAPAGSRSSGSAGGSAEAVLARAQEGRPAGAPPPWGLPELGTLQAPTWRLRPAAFGGALPRALAAKPAEPAPWEDLGASGSRLTEKAPKEEPVPPLRFRKGGGALEGTWAGALGGAAAALVCRLTGSEGTLTVVPRPRGGAAFMTATLEFKEPHLEASFLALWAQQWRASDAALGAAFLAVTAMCELRFWPASQEAAVTVPCPVSILVACQLLLLVGASALKPRWCLAHRSSLNLVTRVFRTGCLMWHQQRAFAHAATCSSSLPLWDILTRGALPAAVLSLCEGNTLSMHLIGDAVAVAAAVPQGPWLCDNVCGLKTHASCDGVLILQVAVALLFVTVKAYKDERRARIAYLCSSPIST